MTTPDRATPALAAADPCKGHKHSKTLGATVCPKCGRFVPDAEVAASPASWPQRPWRVGRKVGRTIYERKGDRPSDDDPLIGVMDTPELAGLVVLAVNLLPEEHR